MLTIPNIGLESRASCRHFFGSWTILSDSLLTRSIKLQTKLGFRVLGLGSCEAVGLSARKVMVLSETERARKESGVLGHRP